MIKISNLTVKYKKTVIDGFSYEFSKGIYCIFAPSGKGKTTLFNAIAGLVNYDGEIVCDGEISYLFQEDRLLPWLTAYKNIMLTARDKNAAEHYINKFGIAEFADKKPSEMSGGMQRRCALARCFAFGGSIYLLDEPFRGLDEGNAGLVREEIKKLGENAAVLVVTHDETDTASLNATKVIL